MKRVFALSKDTPFFWLFDEGLSITSDVILKYIYVILVCV